jgi:putative PIN family toxin of toxin-antitoxin system
VLVVFDASTIVGSALKASSVPRRALLVARKRHTIALSAPVYREIDEVLRRQEFAKALAHDRRQEILGLLTAAAFWVTPNESVQECRDPKDNKYLELALAAGAVVIVSSDDDLLTLHPWRGVLILRPAEYLALP